MAIFVDGANLFYIQRDRLHWWIDWRRLLSHFQQSFEVVEAFYYRADAGKGSDDFVRMLVSSGYTMRGRPLNEVEETKGRTVKKGNMDVQLVIDALNSNARYDVCLLVSGDGDFVPLIEALRHQGKAVLALSTAVSAAFDLRSTLGLNFHDLQTHRSEFEFLPPPTPEAMPGLEEMEDVFADSATEVLANSVDEPQITQSTATIADQPVEAPVEAVVARVFRGGALLTTLDGTEIYLPVRNLHLSGFVSDLSALIQDGDRLSVIVVALDDRMAPPRKIGSLASDVERDRLQQRLDELTPALEDLPNEGEFELDVQAVKPFGAFLRNPWNVPVLLHVSKMRIGHVLDCMPLIRSGEKVRVRVIGREQSPDGPRIKTALADEDYHQTLMARLRGTSTS